MLPKTPDLLQPTVAEFPAVIKSFMAVGFLRRKLLKSAKYYEKQTFYPDGSIFRISGRILPPDG